MVDNDVDNISSPLYGFSSGDNAETKLFLFEYRLKMGNIFNAGLSLYCLFLILPFIVIECSAQSCSSSDIATLNTCSGPVTNILNSIENNWPAPTPLPALNNSIVSQLCSAYNNYLSCLTPRNLTCGSTSDAVNLVSVVGLICREQFSLFSTQSDCVKTFLSSNNAGLTQCTQLASEVQFHNLMVTQVDTCNAYKDAMSCVYPLVQSWCGANVANALFELTRRVAQTEYSDCQIIQCFNNTYCMYDQTCRSGRSCQCAIVCPQQSLPQCASDSKVYGNDCFLRKQACLQAKWLLQRPMMYCNLYTNNPTQCTDSVVDKYAHCVVPMYNGMIASFQQLDQYLANFNGNMINKTCALYNSVVQCTVTTPPACALPNGAVLNELYQKYVCTDAGFTDLVGNQGCWSMIGNDFTFQQCSQNFGFTVDSLQYYNLGSYVDSFIYDFGGVCTALHDLGACVMPRVQALCTSKAVTVFNKIFQNYKMFMVNCNSVCKTLVDSVYGIISSNNWPAANLDTEQCTWQLSVPAGMNVNFLLRVNQPFDCYPDSPIFLWIYSGSTPNASQLIGTYCGQSQPDNVYSTPTNVNQMTVVYTKTTSNSGISPPFVAMFYAGTNACLSSPCLTGSTCINTAGGYYCQCPAGYTGSLCDRYVGKCNGAVCSNGGTCVDTFMVTDITMFNMQDPSTEFGYYCKCPNGFTGSSCKSAGGTVTEKSDFQCPTNWLAMNQQCYFVSPQLVDEPTSEGACKNATTSGLLTSIHSDAERSYIQQLMVTNNINVIWLGGRDDRGQLRWLDQTTWDYTAWAPNQPDITQRCLIQNATVNYQWQTVDCFSTSAAYICKMSPTIVCDIVNPCQNGGTCTTTNGVGSCNCTSGFTGPLCGTPTTCNPNPCLNSGTCQVVSNVVTCICPPGYNGTTCNVNVGTCNSNPCQNGGRCVTLANGYRCSCPLGYTGTNCQNMTNNCASTPCQNGATCNNGANSFQCSCAAGYTGTLCNVAINQCASLPCQNSGTCVNGVNSYTCNCLSGYTGTNCQTATSSCASNPCSNGGTCTLITSTTFQCICNTGYTGTLCQSTINYCASNPCQNGGVCQSSTYGYMCNCPSQYSGTNCELSPSGNSCTTNPCLNGATCINGATSYFCQCAVGYFGLQCNQSTGVCSNNPCTNGGTCLDLNRAYNCKCPTGYSGTQCQYATPNVCLTNNPCLNGGVCSYSQGLTICSCPSGFQGPTCAQAGPNPCSNFPCQNGGTCISGFNYYYCQCPANYIGLNCQTVVSNGTACSSNPCQNGGSCTNTLQGFLCSCTSGWSGTLCNVGSYCSNNLCQNGATCVQTSSSYTCTCPSGYTGYYCENNANSCLSNPCQNGGTCTNGVNSFTCQCTSSFGGPTCSQSAGSMCTPDPCQNSGQCVTLSNTNYLCRCVPGWLGASCEVDQNECLQFPCKNNGVCVNTAGSYYCTCQSGYQGTDCSQVSTGGCTTNPCSNGGTCTLTNAATGAYTCTCLPEYTGPTCNFALCTTGWKYHGGYCYMVITSTVTEPTAKQLCVNNNAQLVSIHDVSERDFVASIMTASNVARAWIGAQYGSSWSWVDQSSWSYTSWATSQPASPSTLTCAHQILQNGVTWETESCTGSEATVCKMNGRIIGIGVPCSSNPCQNSGTCSGSGSSYICICPAGYGGTNCQSTDTSCQSNPCFNGGTCNIIGSSYVCTCPNGYTVKSNCRLPCPTGWKWFMSKCFLPMSNAVTYTAAVSSCPSQQTSSKLLYVESQDEFYYAATLANQMSSNIWLGLTYDSSTSRFLWTNGAYLGSGDYQAWGVDQPTTPSTLKCVQIVGLQGFIWQTYDCTKTLKYICKWDGSS